MSLFVWASLLQLIAFLMLDCILFGIACDQKGPFYSRYGWKTFLPGSGFWFMFFGK